MIGGAKPLAAPLLGATAPPGRRLAPAACAPDPSPALATAAAQSAGQSDRAPPPRPPDEPAAPPTALRSTSQLTRWSRARALRSGRRLRLDRAAASLAPPVTSPPPTLVPERAAVGAEGDDDSLRRRPANSRPRDAPRRAPPASVPRRRAAAPAPARRRRPRRPASPGPRDAPRPRAAVVRAAPASCSSGPRDSLPAVLCACEGLGRPPPRPPR